MSVAQQVVTIAIIVGATVFTRMIAFVVFPAGKETPKYIRYLGSVLPASALGMLVVYCLKDASIFSPTHAIPEILGVATVCILHFWKKNMFLSIVGGTVVYMVLVNLVF